MKRFNVKKLAVLCFVMVATMGLVACTKPYDKPEFVTIEASQTAFLIPLVGDTSEQASFESEEMLAQAKVATKEIQIPHRWVQTGKMSWTGEYRASAKLIVVERKPITRSWESTDETTNITNKAIFGESLDAIGVYVGMNCSAQINEEDATKFLYRYNNTPLEQIIDTDIRGMVEDVFNKECSKYLITDLHANKETIMNNVVSQVKEHFKEYGITITVLGMKEGISYENKEIQKAIDEKFSSEQKLVTQQNENAVAIAKAKAEAEAIKIAAEAEAAANKLIANSLTSELIEKIKYEAWDGVLPQVQGNSTPIIDMSGTR